MYDVTNVKCRYYPYCCYITLWPSSEILAGGTSHGRIAIWKMVVLSGSSRGDNKAQWKLQTPTEIQGNVTQLQVLSGPKM